MWLAAIQLVSGRHWQDNREQIAAELGFEDEAYFGRFFKKHTGQRPTDFRREARAQLAGA